MTESEKVEAKCVRDCILNVQGLFSSTTDYKTIKRTLEKYPIDPKEKIYDLIESDDWQTLFRHAVDINNDKLIDSAIHLDAAAYKQNYYGLSSSSAQQHHVIQNGVAQRSTLPSVAENFDNEVKKIKEHKRELLENYILEQDEQVRVYNRKYFQDLLEKKDYENIAKNLCDKVLEFIFKKRYRLEEQIKATKTTDEVKLREMINEYAKIKEINQEEKNLLHILRMYRNKVSHYQCETDNTEILNNMLVGSKAPIKTD